MRYGAESAYLGSRLRLLVISLKGTMSIRSKYHLLPFTYLLDKLRTWRQAESALVL